MSLRPDLLCRLTHCYRLRSPVAIDGPRDSGYQTNNTTRILA
ncbi:hypothetical protein [Synechococcus sp. PCC 7336]|nr:hypothetical protein [Synechococcus sp. PCC 7336]